MQDQNNNYGQPMPQDQPPQQAPPQYQQPNQPYPNQYAQQPPPGYPPPPQGYGEMPPEMAAQKDANDNKLMAILCYFSLLWLVPLLTKTHEKSPFTKFHLNQGILLLALQVVYWIVWGLLSLTRTASTVIIGFSIYTTYTRPWWAVLITSALSLFILVLAIIGIVNAAKGEQKKLPLIGDLYTFFK